MQAAGHGEMTRLPWVPLQGVPGKPGEPGPKGEQVSVARGPVGVRGTLCKRVSEELATLDSWLVRWLHRSLENHAPRGGGQTFLSVLLVWSFLFLVVILRGKIFTITNSKASDLRL